MCEKGILCKNPSLPFPDACPSSNPPCWGFLEDYAFVVRGLLDLYEASLESAWLEWALRLQDTQDKLFWDSRGGGYFCSEAELGAGLPLRLKDGQCEAGACRAGFLDPTEAWFSLGEGYRLSVVVKSLHGQAPGPPAFTSLPLTNRVTLGLSYFRISVSQYARWS